MLDDLSEEELIRRVAHHEGGHAVSAHLDGMVIQGAFVRDETAMVDCKWWPLPNTNTQRLERFRAEVAMSASGVLAEHYMLNSDVIWLPTVDDLGPCPDGAEAREDWAGVARRRHAYIDLDYATSEDMDALTREGIVIAHERYKDYLFRTAVARVADLLMNELDMFHPVLGPTIVRAIEGS